MKKWTCGAAHTALYRVSVLALAFVICFSSFVFGLSSPRGDFSSSEKGIATFQDTIGRGYASDGAFGTGTILSYWTDDIFDSSKYLYFTMDQLQDLALDLSLNGIPGYTYDGAAGGSFTSTFEPVASGITCQLSYIVSANVYYIVADLRPYPDSDWGTYLRALNIDQKGFCLNGRLLVARPDESSSAGSTDKDYYQGSTSGTPDQETTTVDGDTTTITNVFEDGDTVTNQTFDYSNGTWYDNVSGTVNDIETLLYSPITKTYIVNNYYSYTFYYNYTYVYNIGSSGNYVQEYEFYYKLPDGRSSADLTEEDLAGLSLDFDIINYSQSSTDSLTDVLCHFDGTWDNSSFSGTEFPLNWVIGPSVTYLDSAAFEGSLFLDGLTHSFYFSNFVPSVSNGYTVQFRFKIDGPVSSTSSIPFLNNPASIRIPVLLYNGYEQLQLGIYGSYICLGGLSSAPAKVPGVVPYGSWVDFCLSVVPVSDTSYQIYVFLNGDNVISYRQNNVDSLYNPVFVFNTLRIDNSNAQTDWYSTSDYEVVTDQSSFPAVNIDNLRIVNMALYTSTSSYVPSPVPFDTNLVYVLPDTTNLAAPTIAVQDRTPVSAYRVGGVRPTFPDTGMVWMPVEDNRIQDCQIYNGSYWQSVGCRVWTGSRWVPAWAYDVVLQQDLWDMYGNEEIDSVITLSPEAFYSWFQEQWYEFSTTISSKLDAIITALGGTPGSDDTIDTPDAEGNVQFSSLNLIDKILSELIELSADIVSQFVSFVLDLLLLFIKAILDFLTSAVSLITTAVTPIIALQSFVTAFSGFTSVVFGAFPQPIMQVLFGIFALTCIIALIRFFLK